MYKMHEGTCLLFLVDLTVGPKFVRGLLVHGAPAHVLRGGARQTPNPQCISPEGAGRPVPQSNSLWGGAEPLQTRITKRKDGQWPQANACPVYQALGVYVHLPKLHG